MAQHPTEVPLLSPEDILGESGTEETFPDDQTAQNELGVDSNLEELLAEHLESLPAGLPVSDLLAHVQQGLVLLLKAPSELALKAHLGKFAQSLKEKGYPSFSAKDLRKEFDRLVAEQSSGPPGQSDQEGPTDGTSGLTLIQSVVPGAPVPADAVVPGGWIMTPYGVVRNIPGQGQVRILSTPVVITGRHIDAEDGCESVELAWVRDGGWKTKVVGRGIIASKTSILALASDGFPITTGTSESVVQYLAELEQVNLPILPRTTTTRALGWVDDLKAFLWGKTLLRSLDGPPSSDLSETDKSTPAKVTVAFQGADKGDEQLASGFRMAGSFEEWRKAVEPFLDRPKIRLTILTALCPPLLELLDVPNPIVELCGDTSRGKSIALRLAASVWGCPDEKSPRAAMGTWDVTRVGVERSLRTMNHLPLILDDTSRCKEKELLDKVVYDVVAGRGRIRGSLTGTQEVATWRTAMLSSGEGSVNGYAERGGARARVLSLWGSPFGEVNHSNGLAVKELNDRVMAHYGHAGPMFVLFLLNNRAKWDALKNQHRQLTTKYQEKAKDNSVIGRAADVFGLLELTGQLAAEAFEIPVLGTNPIDDLWTDLTSVAREADTATRALLHVLQWARDHEEEFHGRRDRERPQPLTGWAGRWDREADPARLGTLDTWTFLAFSPLKLRQVLKEAGFEEDAVRRVWRDRGWLKLDSEGKDPQIRIQTGEKPRLVTIHRSALEAAEGVSPVEQKVDET